MRHPVQREHNRMMGKRWKNPFQVADWYNLAKWVAGVYEIRCLVNGNIYIGQSWNIPFRWLFHICEIAFQRHHNNRLQADMRKYGLSNFTFKYIKSMAGSSKIEREIYESRCIRIAKIKASEYGFEVYNIKN